MNKEPNTSQAERLYRVVKISDRLPDTNGNYFTKRISPSGKVYNATTVFYTEKVYAGTNWDTVDEVVEWLEELPTPQAANSGEDEITRVADLFPTNSGEDGWISVDTPPELTEPLIGYNDEGEREVFIENWQANVLGWNQEVGVFTARLTKGGWAAVSKNSINTTIVPTHWKPQPQPPIKP